MENYLRIKGIPASPANADVYININNITGTGSDFSSSLWILTNESVGANGYVIELQNAAGDAMDDATKCRATVDALNNALFTSKPAQGVITLLGEYNLWDNVEYTQVW